MHIIMIILELVFSHAVCKTTIGMEVEDQRTPAVADAMIAEDSFLRWPIKFIKWAN